MMFALTGELEQGSRERGASGPWKTTESSGAQRLTIPAALVPSSSRTGLSAQTSIQKGGREELG